MHWDEIDKALPALICKLIGIPVQWGTQPEKFRTGAQATLDVLVVSGLGIDDVLYADVDDPANPGTPKGVQPSVIGQREFTLQIAVWSRSQKLGCSARKYMGRLRTRLRFPSTLESFRQLGLALIAEEALVVDDQEQDGRTISRALMDVRFAFSVTETDEEIPYIESVRISSGTTDGQGIEDAGGSPLPVQVDITVPEP